MAPGDIIYSPSALLIHLRVKGNDSTRVMTDRVYALAVDQFGQVEITRYPGQRHHGGRSTDPNFQIDRDAWREAIEELIEAELLRWQAIGPEDSELFVTDEFHKQFDLTALWGDSQLWPVKSHRAETG